MKFKDVIDALHEAGQHKAIDIVRALHAKASAKRRPGSGRRPVVSQPMTPAVRDEIKRLHLQFPSMTNHEIASIVRVNQGRVSEAINGKYD